MDTLLLAPAACIRLLLACVLDPPRVTFTFDSDNLDSSRELLWLRKLRSRMLLVGVDSPDL